MARRRWAVLSSGGLRFQAILPHSQDKHTRLHVLSVPVTDEKKSILSAAMFNLTSWSRSNNIWKKMKLYAVAMSDSKITMLVTSRERERLTCIFPLQIL